LIIFLAVGYLYAQQPQLPDTMLVCNTDSVQLDAGEGFTSYLWSTDEQGQVIWVHENGWFYVLVTTESMEVIEDSTWVFMQNASINVVDTILTCYSYPVTLCVEPDTLKYVWTSNDPDLFIDFDTAACIDVIPIHDTTTVYAYISDSAGVMTCVDSVEIWLYPRMTFEEVNQINTGCPGTCKGQLQVIVSGGLPPYSYIWPTTSPVQFDSIAFGLCETDYLFQVTDQNGCVRDTILSVEVYDMIEVEIAHDPENNIFVFTPVTFSFENLSIDSIEVIDWNWDFGDSTFSKEREPIKLFDQVRYYDVWLKFTTQNECIDSVVRTVDVVNTGNIDEIDNKKYQIIPNPNIGRFHVEIPENENFIEIDIIDATGLFILSKSKPNFINSNSLFIDISDVNPGIYFLRILKDDGMVFRRFIKW